MTELRKTPLHEEHRRLGARLVPFAGWEMPVQYRGITAEHEAVRLRAGLFDVSHMGELWIRGPGAAARVRELVTNDVAGLADGRAAYAFACREDGGILDDLIVYRLAEDRVLVVCNAGNHPKIAAHFAARLRGGGLDDASDRTALLALQGPRAAEALATITPGMDTSEAALPRNSVREAAVAGVTCLVARTGDARNAPPGRLPRQAGRGAGRGDALLQASPAGLREGSAMAATEVRDDRKYTKDHEWALERPGEILVGITAFAVDQLGDVTLVNLDVGPGDRVEAGKVFGTIESVKTLSDLYAPVSGRVVRVNQALEEAPELVNEDCWDRGWMLAIEPDGPAATLLAADAYRKLVAENAH